MSVTIVEYGDCGLLVTFADGDRDARWSAAQQLQQRLLGLRSAGIVDVVASFDTAFITFDLKVTDHATISELLAEEPTPGGTNQATTQDFTVPVVYGGERGPDLEIVAAELQLTPQEVVELHTSSPWTVRFRGSPVAAPMMDGPSLPASISRNPAPRTRVLPGAVGLSGQQCLIYPVPSPGGWRLIGQVPAQLWSLHSDTIDIPYRPGDRFHFSEINEADWDRYAVPLVPDPAQGRRT